MGRERGVGRGRLSRMETSRSKTIGNHPGTTCANYFTKQSLSRGSRRRCCESRSTVTILVRSGRYNVAGQCLPFRPQCRMSRHIRRTSVATRGFAHPAVRLGRDRSRLTETSFPMNVRTTTWLEYILGGTYPLILLCNMRIEYAKMWGTRFGNDDKSRLFFLPAVIDQLRATRLSLSLMEVSKSRFNQFIHQMDIIFTISIQN